MFPTEDPTCSLAQETGTFYFSGLISLCLCAHTPFFSLYPIERGGLAASHRARVQRGESATARCASTGNRQAPFPFLNPCSPELKRVAEAALDCAQPSHPPNPERAETRSCPRRAHSYRARSASTKGTWPLLPHPSKLARSLLRDEG